MISHAIECFAPGSFIVMPERKNLLQLYLIRYDPLKKLLRERTLTDREALPYFILFGALLALATSLPRIKAFNLWDALDGLAIISITILGTLYCYKQNGGSFGYDFIQKFIVLGWIVVFRCLLVFIPACVIIYICGAFFGVVGDKTTWLDFLVMTAFQIIYYQRLGRHLEDTR